MIADSFRIQACIIYLVHLHKNSTVIELIVKESDLFGSAATERALQILQLM